MAALLGVLSPLMGGDTTPAGGDERGAAGDSPSWWRKLHVRGVDGAPLNPAALWYVVVFLGQECPVSNTSIPVLNKLAAEFTPRGFAFVGAYVDQIGRAHV